MGGKSDEETNRAGNMIRPENTRVIRLTEIALIVVFLLAVILPQVLGNEETAQSGTPGETVEKISSPEDLHNGRFAAVLGSTYALMVQDLFPEATINYVTDWAEECIQVGQGKADATLWEASSLNELYEEYPDLIALPDPVLEMPFCWCTQKTKNGEKLLQEVNTFVNQLREEGTLEEIYHRWEDPASAPDRVENFPMTGEPQGELKFVSCLDWQPVCYQNGQNACGYMIELAYRFCAWAGYTPVPEYVDIQSIQAGFYTGKYDLMVYGMEWQEEVAEIINFTDPIMSDDIFVIIAKDRWSGATQETASDTIGSVSKAERFLKNMKNSLEKNFVREGRWKMLLSGLGVTVALSVLSILFGTILGGIICLMRMSRNPLPTAFARIYIRTLQGMPIVLMLLILYYIVFQKVSIAAFWVCVLAFTLDFSAYASEMFRSGIQAVPEGQRKAARALGFTGPAAFREVIFPQMVIHCLPVYMGQVISTVKLTSVAGYISVLDLTRVSDLIRSRTYEAFFPLILTAIVYFLVAWLLTLTLKWLERRLDPMHRDRRIKGVTEHAD